jgi:hypothetical protein
MNIKRGFWLCLRGRESQKKKGGENKKEEQWLGNQHHDITNPKKKGTYRFDSSSYSFFFSS